MAYDSRPVTRLAPIPPNVGEPVRPAVTDARVVSNVPVAPEHFRIRLLAPYLASSARPGQFAMLTVARADEVAPVLPRPMAIYDRNNSDGTIDIVYRVVGEGTRRLAEWPEAVDITTVGPLGRGFAISQSTTRVVLIGRGIGLCSLTMLAREAQRLGVQTLALASGRFPEAIVGLDIFAASGDVLVVNDLDRSSDVANVKKALSRRLERNPPQQMFTCGSERLLRLSAELAAKFDATVQVSLEAHMACGLGYCHGCSSGQRGMETEAPLVCLVGPVFSATCL